MTSADVHRERSSLLQPSIEAWFESNLKAILAGELAKTFKDQGLCVITGTYSVTKVLLNAWKGKGTTANCGFNAQALSRVGFKGDGDWYEGHTVGTWISGLAEVSSATYIVPDRCKVGCPKRTDHTTET